MRSRPVLGGRALPKFHFHVRDGEYLPDEDGTELPNLAAAKREAVAFAGRLLADNAEKFWAGDEWFVEVADGNGPILFKLLFAAIPAAVSMP